MIVVGHLEGTYGEGLQFSQSTRSFFLGLSVAMPFFPAPVSIVDLTTERLVRFTLLPELLVLPVARFDCFFIRAKNTPIQK